MLERNGWSISAIVLWELAKPVQLDFRADPADGIIAATSAVHNVPLLTRNRVIGQSKLVPLALPPA